MVEGFLKLCKLLITKFLKLNLLRANLFFFKENYEKGEILSNLGTLDSLMNDWTRIRVIIIHMVLNFCAL